MTPKLPLTEALVSYLNKSKKMASITFNMCKILVNCFATNKKILSAPQLFLYSVFTYNSQAWYIIKVVTLKELNYLVKDPMANFIKNFKLAA